MNSEHSAHLATGSVGELAAELHRHATTVPITEAHNADVLFTRAGETMDRELVEDAATAGDKLQNAARLAGNAAASLTRGSQNLANYAASLAGKESLDLPVYVEHRTYGNTNYTVTLASHNYDTVGDMCHALQECDVIAIESVGGGPAASRAKTEEMYTLLLQANQDPEIIRDIFEKLKVADPGVIPRILEQFVGTNKEVVFIDTPDDHPQHAETAKYLAVRDAIKKLIQDVASVDAVRAAAGVMNVLGATTNAARDEIMKGQLQALDGELTPGTTVGVVIGKEHFPVLDALEPVAEAPVTDYRGIVRRAGMNPAANLEYAETGAIPAEHQDRQVLSMYLAVYASGDLTKAEAIVNTMGIDEVDAVLATIDYAAAQPDDIFLKRRLLERYFEKVVARHQNHADVSPEA